MSCSRYRSYLIRIWREDGNAEPSWRLTLTSLGDNRQQGFVSLDRLVIFMKEEIAAIVSSELGIIEDTKKECTE